uniref:Stabilin 2 n=1 Tax=Astyanax mexicanus TaxID=7994 RepID=A0A8B9K9U2_ASTMX
MSSKPLVSLCLSIFISIFKHAEFVLLIWSRPKCPVGDFKAFKFSESKKGLFYCRKKGFCITYTCCPYTGQVMTKSDCHSCSVSALMMCPKGYHKKNPGKGQQDCRYTLKTVSTISIRGCSHECYKEVVEEGCCPGYWGIDCVKCPGSAAKACSNNGQCSDGIGGNGTCTCKAGFVGTACEKCNENLYGPTCSNVCSCKHGLCNSGIKGNGQCTCFSGYSGLNCDRELPDCAALRCGLNGFCTEDVSSGKLKCQCKPGYAGDGMQCTSVNPCVRSVCHQHAVCVHTGPNQHTCTCAEGYEGDGLVCMAIDPCQTDLGGCPRDSTRCVYDGPGKAHCECLPGFDKMPIGVGCRLRDVCRPDSCHKDAKCTTTAPGKVECTCLQGFIGNGKICVGNIMQRLQELNTLSSSPWTGQLSSAITLFGSVMSWPLSSLGPFTVFVPNNKAFKSTSVKTLVADEAKARYLVKMHMVAREVNSDDLKKGILYYTMTAKTAESVTESNQVKVRIHGSRRKGTLVESDIIASNGLIHIIDKMLDTVPSTVISDNQENLLKILIDNGRFSKFKSLLEVMTAMANMLDEAGPYTVFAPTNEAFSLMKEGTLEYIMSDEVGPPTYSTLTASYIVSNPQTESLANQALMFNVTAAGQILVNGIDVVEADVEAKNGRLYAMNGLLIPASIDPILPHRCDITENSTYRGPCVSCALVSMSMCPRGVSLNTFVRGCVYIKKTLGVNVPVLGCSLLCNETRTISKCCKGFFGSDCSPCPGGFEAPCLSHGKCFEGIDGNGTCQCEPNFKGFRCQYCANPNKYGPSCDQTCGCVQGVCDNRPEAHGTCKPNSCKPGFAGQLCDKHAQPCGPNQPCHAHADCVYSGGALTCVCKPGFQGDGFQCVETDPCASPPNGGCSENARCIKTGPGVRRCECVKGWKEDGDECQPVNNCLESSRGGCHPFASCIYVGPGQNYCVCKKNYHGNGRDCEPINECVEQIGGCHERAICSDVGEGRFQCVCQRGYSGDGSVCYGTLVQELANNPDLSGFNTWINRADLTQLVSDSQNMTLFVPSAQAIGNLSKDDQDFWLSSGNLPSLLKNHIVSGLFSLSDLRSSPSPQLVSLLKRTLPVSWTNETTRVAGSTIVSGDMVAKNGFIHLIDTVLISDHKMSEGLLEVLDQRPEFSMFRDALINFNLTEQIEKSSGFTVFAPTNTTITEYLKSTGQDSLYMNVTKYHIILGETLRQADFQDGLFRETMLGFSSQLGIFQNDSNWLVNKAPLITTDIESTSGVIHGVSGVLKIPKNRCDVVAIKTIRGKCMDCFHPPESRCPAGTEELKTLITKRKCAYRKMKQGIFIGCQADCQKRIIKRKCCKGFYGVNCENCPGPEGRPCFDNGVCVDGINGTGVCQCNPGFNGTACETCESGKYGIHCDQECKCVHGWCNEGLEGDGSCQCEVGWRGVSCSVAITSDSCGGKCHSSANCLLKVDDRTYYCSCAAGYEGNGTHCTAVNPCEKDNGGCSYNAVCKRTVPGRRQCVCKPGYAGDGKVCVSINPCLDGNGGCNENSDCIHTGPNKTACVCKPGYTGDGKKCAPINLCNKKNGGCHKLATCTMTSPGERNCSCPAELIGDGMYCKDNVMQVRTMSFLLIYFHTHTRADAYFLQGRGPYTVFAPNKQAFNKPEPENKMSSAALMLYHIVPCRSLLVEDLTQPRNLTTLTGEILTISYSQGTVYINNKVKVVYSDQESSNGIFHEIDSVLIPPSFQKINELKIADNHGFKTFFKLLEDTEVLKKVMDKLHQPATLFLPTDYTMASLPQEQKDFLYGQHNRAQLVEYLEYHILRDTKVLPAELVHHPLNTLQGSDISVSCAGEQQIGQLYINEKSCRFVKMNLNFNGGIVYGIDCLLTPPSLGGRCDQKDVIDITVSSVLCPADVTIQKCDLPKRLLAVNAGCQSVCSMVIWKPKCCSGYYGRDCLACPGGSGSPCSNHGQCDEDRLGNGTCTCNAGFQGVACELCTEGRFGPDCKACNCSEHGSCDEGIEGTGSCFCDEGWTGPRCDHKLGSGPLCIPSCHEKAVCTENSTCVCRPFYMGDGITCTVADLCQFWNGGCSKNAKCSQTGEKVTCTCPKGYTGDGYVCSLQDLCVTEDNGGCHEHAICTVTGPVRIQYILCTHRFGTKMLLCILHKTVGVFHYRSPLGVYKLNYTQAQESCQQEGGTIATYVQLSYAQQAGYSMCSAGWLAEKRVGYPMSYSRPACGFGHVGIVDYGTQTDLSKNWDTFCYRIKASTAGQEFVKRLSNITVQSTLFVPDNNGLYDNETLSYRDLEHHLLDGRALILQALINVTHVRTRLGHTLNVKGVPSLKNPQSQSSSGYINDRYVIEPDVLASNGIIHVLQGPLKAPPPPPPSLPQSHKAGMGVGVLLLIVLIIGAIFVAYHFYNQQSKPFQFHYFKEDEREDTSPSDSTPYMCNPMYESSPAPTAPEPPVENVSKIHNQATVLKYSLIQEF